MQCESMTIDERPIVLFIFAYQILMNMEMKATPRAGTLACEKTKDEAGTPASEKENGRGLPQLKMKRVGTLAKEKEKGRDSGKRKKENVAGTPAKEKKYVAGTPAIER